MFKKTRNYLSEIDKLNSKKYFRSLYCCTHIFSIIDLNNKIFHVIIIIIRLLGIFFLRYNISQIKFYDASVSYIFIIQMMVRRIDVKTFSNMFNVDNSYLHTNFVSFLCRVNFTFHLIKIEMIHQAKHTKCLQFIFA